MINFPLYQMRQYREITQEDGYTIIQTARNRYVLDLSEPWANTYAQRRVLMLSINLPYDLYPIRKRIESLSQLMKTKCRKFIDATGEVVTWKPAKFYDVECLPITSFWQNTQGKWTIEVKGIPTKFIVSYATKFAQVVKMGNRHVLFDLIDERVPTTRKKI